MRKLKLEELGRVDVETYKSINKLPVVLILDNIRSAMNVGSLFRSSDAYAIEQIILCGISAQPPHREILKTAIGATESVTWKYVPEVVDASKGLRDDGYHIIGVEQTDKSLALNSFIPKKDQKYAIILGNEVKGISDAVLPYLDQAIEIIQYGTKHSLNVSVCGGVVLHHFSSCLRDI